MTSTAVIMVAYRTPTLDLRWVPAHAEVVVVTNDGAHPDIVPEREVHWIDPGQNLGFGAAVNQAAASTDADRLIVVNPDCELQPEHWPPLAWAQPDELVTVPLRRPDGSSTIVVAPRYRPFGFVLGALRARHRLRRSAPGLAQPAAARPSRMVVPLTSHWVSGAVFSVDHQVFDSVGGFDSAYFLYYEDTDLCVRLAAAHPELHARVADTVPGIHQVGTSGTGDPAVEAIRASSAARFASRQPGTSWRIAERVARRRARRLCDRAGALGVTPKADVVIVSLGRRAALGERRRARSWRDIAAAAGLTATEVRLSEPQWRTSATELFTNLPSLASGQLVPEAFTWSAHQLGRTLAANPPRWVVVLTSRSYHPDLADGPWSLVLDYVDRLSDSYRDRRRIVGRWTIAGLGYALLARGQARFERAPHNAHLEAAAGLADAASLGVTHVPNLATKPPPTRAASALAPVDLVFVGNLAYAPNVQALRELADTDEHLARLRPGTTIRIAGAAPSDEVRRLVAARGWELAPDFEVEGPLYDAATLAVAPITHASGMQNKIIDAFEHGVPVVAYTQVAQNFPEGAPITRADGAAELAQRCVELLDDPRARQALSRTVSRWVADHLDPATWAHLLDGGRRGPG